jgi:hypothetical protein
MCAHVLHLLLPAGVLTKEGKRSRARRMLLEAMHIIKKELRQSAQAAGSKAK